MNAQTIQQTWAWLLSLSKIQLILLGGGVAALVAVSKVMRFFFLIGLLVVLLVGVLPEVLKRYEDIPLPTVIKEFILKGSGPAQEPPPQPEPRK